MTSPSTPLVLAESLSIRLGGTEVIRDVDLAVRPGADVAVTGRSGSGKTTLLLALAGLIPVTGGRITWPGLLQGSQPPRGRIGLVFQAPSLVPELSAQENVTLPLRLSGVDLLAARAAATSALALLGVLDCAEALPAQLSGGQQQRIAVARALAGGHQLVLADEPTGALDRGHAHEVVRALIDGVRAAGGALLLATHDPELADMLDERVVVDEGLLVQGAPR
ncbi:MAG: putative transport system ATP-binding protein [Actinomycetota bacterium]|jgi:putative ABC transport system ATP-binding protein|nr:putative transport system ATP-binding protein [Actinomycetota bacterium]